MKEEQMVQVADMMYRVSQTVKKFEYKETKEERRTQLKEFREFIRNNEELKSIKKEVN